MFHIVSPFILSWLAKRAYSALDIGIGGNSPRQSHFAGAIETFLVSFHLQVNEIGGSWPSEETRLGIKLSPEAERFRKIINDPSNGDGLPYDLGFTREWILNPIFSTHEPGGIAGRDLYLAVEEYLIKTEGRYMSVLKDIAGFLNENQRQILGGDSKALRYKDFFLGNLLLAQGQQHYRHTIEKVRVFAENNPRLTHQMLSHVRLEPVNHPYA